MPDPHLAASRRREASLSKPPLFLSDRGHRLADVVEFPLERKAVEALDRKAEK
jgi:hypothetical protein